MKNMKWVFLLVGFIAGMSVGLVLGLRSTERKVIEAYPVEVRPAVEGAAELLGEMDKEETKALLRDMQTFANQAVKEGDWQTLWQAATSLGFLRNMKEGGDLEEAKRSARMHLEYFVERYDRGDMELGEWGRTASALREAIDHESLLEEEHEEKSID